MQSPYMSWWEVLIIMAVFAPLVMAGLLLALFTVIHIVAKVTGWTPDRVSELHKQRDR